MKKYKGNCHCGAVTFELNGEITELMECNCSHCDIKGFKMVFTPKNEVEISGIENLSEYKFNKGQINHTFCKTCGVQPLASSLGEDGSEYIMINARCIDDEEVRNLPIKHVDGKSL